MLELICLELDCCKHMPIAFSYHDKWILYFCCLIQNLHFVKTKLLIWSTAQILCDTRSCNAFASGLRYTNNDINEVSMITIPTVLKILVCWMSNTIYKKCIDLQLPQCWHSLIMWCFLNQEDADLLVAMARQLSVDANFDEFEEKVVRKLSLCASGNLAPINAFIGGLAAQEVMKVRNIRTIECTGRLMVSDGIIIQFSVNLLFWKPFMLLFRLAVGSSLHLNSGSTLMLWSAFLSRRTVTEDWQKTPVLQ